MKTKITEGTWKSFIKPRMIKHRIILYLIVGDKTQCETS